MTAGIAPRVAPTIGMRSAIATHIASGSEYGTRRAVSATKDARPAMTETPMFPSMYPLMRSKTTWALCCQPSRRLRGTSLAAPARRFGRSMRK